jgi:Na+-driven multidrug efflux pump
VANREIKHPAFLGAIGMAIYYFTDGLFIGNALGDDGMSAISISWVIVIFLISIGTGIGMGASIQYSIALGKDDRRSAKNFFLTTLILLFLASAVLTVVFLFFSDDLLRFLGATGNVLASSQDYTNLVVYCIIFQVMGIGTLPLVRNMGGHSVASIAMGTGYLVNFILDYVLMFIFPLGMVGCSIAYIAGQIIIAVPCLTYLFIRYKKEYRNESFSLKEFSQSSNKIAASGLSPFGAYFSQNIVSMLINRAFLSQGGSEGLASYTVVIYIAGITNTLHRAIMDGSQPLMSRYYGEGDEKASTHAAKSMYIFSAILILTGAAATLLLKTQVASFFGVSEVVTQIVAERLPLYIFAYILVCFSRTTITYLYATEKNKKAGILTYSEPLLYIALLMILPRFFGLDGIWTTILTVWLSMAVLTITFLVSNTSSRKMKKQEA